MMKQRQIQRKAAEEAIGKQILAVKEGEVQPKGAKQSQRVARRAKAKGWGTYLETGVEEREDDREE